VKRCAKPPPNAKTKCSPKPSWFLPAPSLAESAELREALAAAIAGESLHAGLESEKIFTALLAASAGDASPDLASIATSLPERDSRLLYEIMFEPPTEMSVEEAESCLAVLRRRLIESELTSVQRKIETNPAGEDLRTLLTRKQELRRQLTEL
jgi:hypothetical protein